MLTDSLLDFLHLYASPAILFNLNGDVLFVNQAAELCQGGEIAVDEQLRRQLFLAPTTAEEEDDEEDGEQEGTAIARRDTPVDAAKEASSSNTALTDPSARNFPPLVTTSIHLNVEPHEYDFTTDTTSGAAGGGGSFPSTFAPSSSSSANNSRSASPTSMTRSTHAGTHGAFSPARIRSPVGSRPSSRDGPVVSVNSNGGNNTTGSRRSSRSSFSLRKSAFGHGSRSGSFGPTSPLYDFGDGTATPRGEDLEQIVTWRITQTKCQRVVALALEGVSASTSSDTTDMRFQSASAAATAAGKREEEDGQEEAEATPLASPAVADEDSKNAASAYISPAPSQQHSSHSGSSHSRSHPHSHPAGHAGHNPGQAVVPLLSGKDVEALRQHAPALRMDWRHQPRFGSVHTGGGMMGARFRAYDWASHPLGPMETWPQPRIEMISFVLRSPVPMTAYLEKEAYIIYNDAYIPVLGATKHAAGALGNTARAVWSEIWQYIEVPLADAMNGIPIERKDQLLFFERLENGGPLNKHEEVHATWYYIPYWGTERVIGNIHMLFEQKYLITDRRFSIVNDLSVHLLSSRSTIDLCRNALETLSQLEADLPYCLAYTTVEYEPPELLSPSAETLDGTNKTLMNVNKHISISSNASSYSATDPETRSNIHVFALQETVGCAYDSSIAPSRIVVDTDDDPATPLAGPSAASRQNSMMLPNQAWQSAMVEMVKTGKTTEVINVQDWLTDVPHRGLQGRVPYRAVVIPLKQGETIVACIALVLNPALPFEDEFRKFIDILARQMNLSLSMVKTYEQEVQRAEELAALDRAKTSFFTSISHELRTPLTLILGPIKDLTQDSSLSRAQAASINLVYRNARRLLRLVNSILDFARAEAGKLSSHFAPVALGVITTELASSFRSAVENAGIEFRVQQNVPEDLLVWVDIDKWEKIVFNLVSNAFKFTTQGSITVRMRADHQHFYLEVQDTGIGIPANELSSIFERFVRVENSQARSIEGSGIGLSLALELVKAHGGKIGVESVWQKGTSFKIKIPLGNEHLPKQFLVNNNTMAVAPRGGRNGTSDDYQLHAADSAFGGTGTRSESNTDESPENQSISTSDLWPPVLFGERARARILLADDNSDLRMFIKSILSKYADVDEAADGQAAWKLLQEKPFDLLLSDIMMPRMTGFQLLAAVRAHETLKSMPVILISARAGEDAGIESLSSGADDHLAKPFSSKELILRVHSHLQLAAIRSELESRVTERTAALEESKESFKRLSELLQVGVHRSDRQGAITWANKKWSDVLGLPEGSWDGWDVRIHPDDREHAEKLYQEAIRTGEGYKAPVEMRLINPNGTVTDITYELQPERNAWGEGDASDPGDTIGFVGVFSDVTSLRALERERMGLERQRREEAEQNRQLQEHFIDVTCHELRNPLNAISNSAELLGESLTRFMTKFQEWEKDDTLRGLLTPMEADFKEDLDAVETILLSSRHQKRIADDVLHISKISGNLVQLVPSEWRPEEALRGVLKMFGLETAAKQIDTSFEVDPSLKHLGEVVIGDEGRFAQVCVNLLANAIKFVDSSPVKKLRIRVGATPVLSEEALKRNFKTELLDMNDLLPLCHDYEKSWGAQASDAEALLHFSVYDSGPGISVEEQSRIFMRFAQASPKTFGEFGGLGLGLWISKRLVEMHGGTVALQSIEGVGTVFRLYIKVRRTLDQPKQVDRLRRPSLSAQADYSPLALPKDPPASFKAIIKDRKPRIMVVEDNSVNLKVLVKLLTTLKCDIVTATDGSVCLEKLEAMIWDGEYPPVDLIFMDLEMPIMDGLTATKRIRVDEASGTRGERRIPIVAVSANARQIYADLSTEAGMNGFLRKPYSKAQLSEVIDRFIIRE